MLLLCIIIILVIITQIEITEEIEVAGDVRDLFAHP